MDQTRCGANTASGNPCKRRKPLGKDFCGLHENSEECSICLNPIVSRSQRSARTLECGHKFHTSCIDRWKRQGNHTCPVCRAVFDIPQYSVTVIVESRRTRERLVTANLLASQETGMRISSLFDLPTDNTVEFVTNIDIEAEDDDALIEVLTHDLGIDLAQINLPSYINGHSQARRQTQETGQTTQEEGRGTQEGSSGSQAS